MSFVVISKVKFPEHLKQEIHAVASDMMMVAKQQPGLIHVAFHQASDESMTMMYWEWRSQTDHDACMQSSACSDILAASAALFQSPAVAVSIETFERLE